MVCFVDFLYIFLLFKRVVLSGAIRLALLADTATGNPRHKVRFAAFY